MLALSRPIGARLLPRSLSRAGLSSKAAAPNPPTSAASRGPEPAAAANPRWLDDIEADLVALRKDARLTTSHHASLGKRIKRLREGRLALLSGALGFLPYAADRGVKDLPVAWGDMDSMRIVRRPAEKRRPRAIAGHVNNVHYNRWAEMGRVNFFRAFAASSAPENEPAWRVLLTPKSLGIILSSITTEFKVPVSFPDTVSIIHRLAAPVDAASTTLHLHGLVFSSQLQRIAAQTREQIVVYDYAAGRRAPLRPFMVEAFQRTWALQEERRLAVQREAHELRALVDELRVRATPGRERGETGNKHGEE